MWGRLDQVKRSIFGQTEATKLPTGILSDTDIAQLCFGEDAPMITPFHTKQITQGKISHGLSSYGYDATLAPSFKVFTNTNNAIIDPKKFSDECVVDKEGDTCIIPPNSFLLGHTIETFDIPKDVLAICLGKSTYARCGLIVNVTPLEPGWRGQVTIEISNTTPLPAIVYANEGVCQFLFLRGATPCQTPYNARAGKYMDQRGVVLPRMLKD